MKYVPVATLASLAAALTVSACGGSGGTASGSNGSTSAAPALKRAQLIAKADAICHAANARRGSLTALQGRPGYVSELAGSERTEFAELSKLVPPSSMASDWKRIVSSGQAFATDLEQLTAVANANDQNAMRPLIAQAREAQEAVLKTARSERFGQCRQTSTHPADR